MYDELPFAGYCMESTKKEHLEAVARVLLADAHLGPVLKGAFLAFLFPEDRSRPTINLTRDFGGGTGVIVASSQRALSGVFQPIGGHGFTNASRWERNSKTSNTAFRLVCTPEAFLQEDLDSRFFLDALAKNPSVTRELPELQQLAETVREAIGACHHSTPGAFDAKSVVVGYHELARRLNDRFLVPSKFSDAEPSLQFVAGLASASPDKLGRWVRSEARESYSIRRAQIWVDFRLKLIDLLWWHGGPSLLQGTVILPKERRPRTLCSVLKDKHLHAHVDPIKMLAMLRWNRGIRIEQHGTDRDRHSARPVQREAVQLLEGDLAQTLEDLGDLLGHERSVRILGDAQGSAFSFVQRLE